MPVSVHLPSDFAVLNPLILNQLVVDRQSVSISVVIPSVYQKYFFYIIILYFYMVPRFSSVPRTVKRLYFFNHRQFKQTTGSGHDLASSCFFENQRFYHFLSFRTPLLTRGSKRENPKIDIRMFRSPASTGGDELHVANYR